MLLGNLDNRIHLRRNPIEMNYANRLCAWGDLLGNLFGNHVARFKIAIHEDRGCPSDLHRADGCHVRLCRHNDLIPFAQAKIPTGKVERSHARVDGDSIAPAHILRKFCFKGFTVWSVGEDMPIQDFENRRPIFIGNVGATKRDSTFGLCCHR